MITGYAQRALECADRALMRFERGRMTLIERVATEYGFEPRRELDQAAQYLTQYLNIDADLDFDSDADPLTEDLMDRFSLFLYALEDRDIGHLRFEVDTEREKRFLKELNLAFVSAEFREESSEASGHGPG